MTTPGKAGRCKLYCPEGNPCTCSADVPHELHICSLRRCPCHSAERYAWERAQARRSHEAASLSLLALPQGPAHEVYELHRALQGERRPT